MPEEPSAAPASHQKGPLPLVLGITGHRDLRKEDDGHLRKSVRAVFDELAGEYPHTPMQLISGLAEGADRLVAEVALERGIALIACLPMEKTAYLADFADEESRREFDALLAKAARVIELPWDGGVPADHGRPAASNTRRSANTSCRNRKSSSRSGTVWIRNSPAAHPPWCACSSACRPTAATSTRSARSISRRRGRSIRS